jgi:hypothetical protein
MSRKIPNASQMGKQGGKKRFEQIGSEGMAEIGAKGNDVIREKYKDTDFFKERSKKATEARLRKKKEREEAEAKSRSPFHKLTDILSGK